MEDKVFINGRSAEIERKWLIQLPDMSVMESMPGYECSAIEQIYLSDSDRIRRRDYGDRIVYYHTHKENINGISRFEEEREITRAEYMTLSKKRLPGARSINKRRHCFEYCGQIVEIDIYDFWSDTATMEIELKSEDQQVFIPDFIEVIKEVTGDKNYSNYGLATNY